MGPVAINSLWSSPELHGTQCQIGNGMTDATVTFDKLAKRWVIQHLVNSAPFYICVAVSTTDDATGAWTAYPFSFNFGSYLADYPKLGTWPAASTQFPQGVYLLSADSYLGGQYQGPIICFIDRGAMLAGLAPLPLSGLGLVSIDYYTWTSPYVNDSIYMALTKFDV